MSIRTFSFPTPIHFGAGSAASVKTHLKNLGYKTPLVVTDKGLAEMSLFKKFVEDLKTAGLSPQIFSGVWGNPTVAQVTEGVKSFKSATADCMIGFGGGAALDVAKAILLMATHSGHLFDYEDDKPGARPIENKIPYWVAIPTTAGTGSEVGRSSVISDDQTHTKKIIFSPYLLARAVFADPELTVALPPHLTAATGMDALTHLIEAYLAKGFHPLCEGIALEGLRLGARSLKKCFDNPSDIQARGEMLMASMMGAIAFQKGLGLIHSCAHSLSAVVDMHHGLANAIMLDYGLKFNLKAEPAKFSEMAHIVGLTETSPQGFIDWIMRLKSDLKIPARLSQAPGRPVTADLIDKLASGAFQDVCHQSNPVSVTAEDFKRIFREAL